MSTPNPQAQNTVAQATRLGGRRAALVAVTVAALALAGFSYKFCVGSIAVPVAPVQWNVREQVFGLGTVGARVQSNVGFKVAGVLVGLTADQGDHVRTGQLLAQLDARDVEAQLALARAGVAQARANIEKAKADVAGATATLANARAISLRRANLVQKHLISQEEAETGDAAARVASANLESAQSAVGVASATLQSAQAQEAFERATLANYALYAPYDAWVVSRNLELGSMPVPGQSVFTLVPADTVWVLGYVDERLAGRLVVGQPAEIVLRSNPAVSLPGHVARIEIQSDAVNEERLVDVAFDRVPENIHLAEQAEVLITTGMLPHAVLVQATAVSDGRAGRGTIWTVENGRLARRQVNLGPQLLDGRLPILQDLPVGARVVARPVVGLRVGRTADITEATAR